MADDPVLKPLIYNESAPYGHRFRTMPSTKIPRIYHSTAILMPSGEVLISGSNPSVGYSDIGKVHDTSPHFFNNGHPAPLLQQQRKTSSYPTEYRVEVFSPPYMSADARPVITSTWWYVQYGKTFEVRATLKGKDMRGVTEISLVNTGFHTHGQGMGQRMVVMEFTGMCLLRYVIIWTWRLWSKSLIAYPSPDDGSTFTVKSPKDGSIMPPGMYMLFVTNNHIPSVAKWGM